MTNTFVLNGDERPGRHRPRHRARRVRRQARRRQVNTATGDFVFGMTEAYLIENGEITEPLREGNLIGNGPQVLRDIDAARQRLRDGQPGHVRQGRPGRARRRRPADPAGEGPHHRRHRSMTQPTHVAASRADRRLQAIADRVVALAQPGEQVEAYVSRDAETDVRVYEGEVEHFVVGPDARASASASSATAAPASPTPARSTRTRVAEVLAEARDNVAFGTPDEWAGLAEPDGVDVHRPGPVERGARRLPHRRARSSWPRSSSGSTLAADPRIRVDDANYADACGEVGRGHDHRHPRAAAARTAATSASARWPTTATRPRPASGSRVGRAPDEFDLGKAAARRRRPGHPAARAPRSRPAEAAHGRARPVRHGPVPRHHRLARSTARAVLKGRSRCSPTASARRSPPPSSRWSTTRPTRWPTPRPTSTARASRRGATSLIDGGVLQQFVHNVVQRPAGSARIHRQRRARRVQGHARRRLPGAAAACPAPRDQDELIADVDDGVLIQSVQGLHSGVNPVSGDFSTGASGLRITDGAARRAAPRVHHRLDAAAHAARRRRGRRRRRLAADARRRRQPGHPRRDDERHVRPHVDQRRHRAGRRRRVPWHEQPRRQALGDDSGHRTRRTRQGVRVHDARRADQDRALGVHVRARRERHEGDRNVGRHAQLGGEEGWDGVVRGFRPVDAQPRHDGGHAREPGPRRGALLGATGR